MQPEAVFSSRRQNPGEEVCFCSHLCGFGFLANWLHFDLAGIAHRYQIGRDDNLHDVHLHPVQWNPDEIVRVPLDCQEAMNLLYLQLFIEFVDRNKKLGGMTNCYQEAIHLLSCICTAGNSLN